MKIFYYARFIPKEYCFLNSDYITLKMIHIWKAPCSQTLLVIGYDTGW